VDYRLYELCVSCCFHVFDIFAMQFHKNVIKYNKNAKVIDIFGEK